MPPTNRVLSTGDPLPGEPWVDYVDSFAEWLASLIRETLSSVAGTSTAYTATSAVPPTALAAGQRWLFTPHVTNGDAPTLVINAFAAKNLAGPDGVNLIYGDLDTSSTYLIEYDGTKFRVSHPPSLQRRLEDQEQAEDVSRAFSYAAHAAGFVFPLMVPNGAGGYHVIGGLNDLLQWDVPLEDDSFTRGYSTVYKRIDLAGDGETIVGGVKREGQEVEWFGELVGSFGVREAFVWKEGIDPFRIGGEADDVRAIEIVGDVAYLMIEIGGNFSRKAVRLYGDTELDAAVDTLYFVPAIGQSNTLGFGAVSAVVNATARDPGRAQMFTAIRSLNTEQNANWLDFDLPDAFLTRLVDAKEVDHGSSATTGLGFMASRLLPNLGAAEPWSASIVVGTYGIGGTTYPQHGFGTTPFENMKKAIERAYVVARVNGIVNVQVPFLWFPSMEAHSATAQATVEGYLDELQDEFQAAVRNIIDEPAVVVPLLMAQPPNALASNAALAMLAKAIASPTLFKLVGPTYLYPYQDTIHRTGIGQEWLAAMAERAFTNDEAPFRCLTAVRTGVNIVCTFGGDFEGNVALRNTQVTDPGNEGVAYSHTGGNSPTIVSVTATAANQVTVVLSVAPTGTSPKLTFAGVGDPLNAGPTTGPRCCIADSSADTVTVDGVARAMHRYVCQQVINVT